MLEIVVVVMGSARFPRWVILRRSGASEIWVVAYLIDRQIEALRTFDGKDL
jgi:hypothetical protein